LGISRAGVVVWENHTCSSPAGIWSVSGSNGNYVVDCLNWVYGGTSCVPGEFHSDRLLALNERLETFDIRLSWSTSIACDVPSEDPQENYGVVLIVNIPYFPDQAFITLGYGYRENTGFSQLHWSHHIGAEHNGYIDTAHATSGIFRITGDITHVKIYYNDLLIQDIPGYYAMPGQRIHPTPPGIPYEISGEVTLNSYDYCGHTFHREFVLNTTTDYTMVAWETEAKTPSIDALVSKSNIVCGKVVVIQDSFTGDDGTRLEDHIPEIGLWNLRGDRAYIKSNQLTNSE
jgi:hypothetical protein